MKLFVHLLFAQLYYDPDVLTLIYLDFIIIMCVAIRKNDEIEVCRGKTESGNLLKLWRGKLKPVENKG